MKVLWTAINTTCLEPAGANLSELSVALQVDGEIVERKDWQLKPIFHHEDAKYGKFPAEKYLEKYHAWLPSKDPRCTLQAYEEEPLFFYSKETLNFLGLKPADLLDSKRSSPGEVLKQLSNSFLFYGDRKWTIAGHNSAFLATALQKWGERVDVKKVEAIPLGNQVDFDRSIDTMQFFRLLASFNPAVAKRGFGLKEIASALGDSCGVSAAEKLDSLLRMTTKIVNGGLQLEHSTSGTLPS